MCFGGIAASQRGLGGAVVGTILGVLACCACSGSFAWWIYDVVMIGTGQILDANGVAMYPMM